MPKQSKDGSVQPAHATIEIEGGAKYIRILGMKKSSRYKRSTMTIKKSEDALHIEIAAHDITALRATVNSALRDLQVASAIVPLNRQKSKSI
ncbi:MAG: KEOPS complex subunit Pcc1 [Candidatus Micrarchaeia archaeon]